MNVISQNTNGDKTSKVTMREFKPSCLIPLSKFSPAEIKAIREKEMVSQAVFAKYLCISKKLFADWEIGVKKPSGAALRLLTIVQYRGLDMITLY